MCPLVYITVINFSCDLMLSTSLVNCYFTISNESPISPRLDSILKRFVLFQKVNKGNNKIADLRTILQRESQNS